MKQWWHWHISNPLFFLKKYIIQNWRFAKTSEFWGRRLQELNFGHLILSKVALVVGFVNLILLISIKWDFDPMDYIIFIGIAILFCTWYLGRFLDRKGVRQAFRQAEFKDVKIESK